MKNIIYIVLLFFLGCSNEKSKQLINDLYSYQSQNEVKKILGDSISFTGEESGVSKAQTKYNHLSEDGTLGLLFFENKLVAVGFYPNDSSAYSRKITEEYGEFSLNDTLKYNGIHIQKGIDYEMGSIGGFFISWRDTDLANQYSNKIW